jgi:FtsZ-binding cell division protein ZapB
VKSQKHSYNLVFGVNTAISKYDIRIEEKDVNNFKNLKEIILPVTFSLELQIKRAGSIDEIDKNSLKLTDLLILLYGYFRDQFVFISNSVDYIYDCHPGNILYFFKENEIVFSWSDFGRSFSLKNNYSASDLKKNDSIFHNKMYFNASIHTFNFIKSMSDNVVLMDILKEIEELSDELKKHSNPKDYFQAMTNKLQLLYEEKLSFGTLKEINKRVGSAIFFFVDNLYKKIDDLIDDVKILKVDSKNLKDDNEIIKKENKNLKNDNEIFKEEIKELKKTFNQFIKSSSKNKNHNSNSNEF